MLEHLWKKYKADVCIFLTAAENMIVKMFSINWEWEKTNTASELLHFLWLKKKMLKNILSGMPSVWVCSVPVLH